MRFTGNGITNCYPDQVEDFISITVLRVQRPDGSVWSIPVGWTDFAPPDPAVVAGRGRAPFRLEDLLRLAEMVSERVRK